MSPTLTSDPEAGSGTHDQPPAGAPAKGSRWGKIALGVVALVVVILLIRQLGPLAQPHVVRFTTWIDGLGVWAPVAFIAGYTVFTVAMIPGSILTMAGGALFGLAWGTVYVALAAVLGSTAAFLVSRHLARHRIEGWIQGNKKFSAVDQAIEREGGKIVFLLRLSPAFPFTFLNYALGLTKVRLSQYVMAAVGMIPGTFLYVFYGKAIGDVAALATGAAPEKGGAHYAVLGLGLVATLVVTVFVTRIARRALQEATDAP